MPLSKQDDENWYVSVIEDWLKVQCYCGFSGVPATWKRKTQKTFIATFKQVTKLTQPTLFANTLIMKYSYK